MSLKTDHAQSSWKHPSVTITKKTIQRIIPTDLFAKFQS